MIYKENNEAGSAMHRRERCIVHKDLTRMVSAAATLRNKRIDKPSRVSCQALTVMTQVVTERR